MNRLLCTILENRWHICIYIKDGNASDNRSAKWKGHYFRILHQAIAVTLAVLGTVANRNSILVNGFIKKLSEIVTN